MICLNKKSFKLPFVEKDTFLLLMRLGLDYNKGQGSYYIKNCNNIEKLLDTIANILDTEKVTFLQSCVLCGKDFPCADCRYYDLCATKDLPFRCVCPQCLRNERLYEEYVERS
jgi:virulence-associated protein VapD